MWKKIKSFALSVMDDLLLISGMGLLVLAASELSRAAAYAAAGVSLIVLALLAAKTARDR